MAGDQSAVFLVLVTNQETGAERFISDDGVTRTWTDPATAAQAAKELNDWAKQHNMLDRYRVIKEGQTKPKIDWRERERQRFLSGKYLHTVWVNHDWATRYVHHFCHVALDDPSYVAYTPDNEYGEADKQLRISPEGYLKKYAADTLGTSSIQQLATDHLDKYGPQPELLWAHTPDEFEHVYTLSHSTVSSCMTHEKSYFSSSVHPVRAYGAGDLALAYLMSADGKTVASRVLCWPAQRKYGRLFGRERRIRLALQKLGYTEGNFNGAKMLKIEEPNSSGVYVVPYIDYHDHVSLGETHLIINGEKADGIRMRCDNTNGQSTPYRRTCYNCGDAISQGDEYVRGTRYWCETCYTEHFTYCEGCHDDVNSDDTRVTSDGSVYCSSCWSERYIECHECGDETDRDEAHEWNDYDYCDDCYTERVAVCDECQTRIDRDDAHEHDDRTLCGDCRAMIETSEEEEQANSEPEHSAA